VALLPVALFGIIARQFIELIKGVDDTAAPVRLQVQVNHDSADVAMAQQFFDGMQIGTGIQQVRGKGMTQGMSAKTFILKACLLHGYLHNQLNTAAMHALAILFSFE